MKKLTENKWYVEIYSWVIRIFIVLTFFFPMYYSSLRKHMYFIGFLWPYAALLPGMALLFLRHFRDKWSNKGFVIFQMALLAIYAALSVYVNHAYHHWMWEEIHNCVAFSFMILLLMYPQWKDDLEFDIIRFLLHCITLSMFCAIIYYLLGYAGLQLYNGQIVMTRVEDMIVKYKETRMSWIYYHKSQFALMQLVFIGFAHRYRRRFRTRLHYGISQAVFFICLLLAHSWTALAGLALLLAGIVLDQAVCLVKEKKVRFRWWYLLAAGVLLAMGIAGGFWILRKMGSERNLLTLGARIPIWKAGIRLILERPEGVGREFGKNLLDCGLLVTNNCHNVFLNAMMRYSIPVGLVFTVIMLSFFGYLLLRRPSFFGAGYLLAVLLVLCIDYSLLSYGVASFLLLVYYAMQPETEEEYEHGQRGKADAADGQTKQKAVQ